MAEPTKKSEGIEETLKVFTFRGEGRKVLISKDLCALCGKKAKEFRDALSEKEYTISGMCQPCQDKVWPPHDPEALDR